MPGAGNGWSSISRILLSAIISVQFFSVQNFRRGYAELSAYPPPPPPIAMLPLLRFHGTLLETRRVISGQYLWRTLYLTFKGHSRSNLIVVSACPYMISSLRSTAINIYIIWRPIYIYNSSVSLPIYDFQLTVNSNIYIMWLASFYNTTCIWILWLHTNINSRSL